MKEQITIETAAVVSNVKTQSEALRRVFGQEDLIEEILSSSYGALDLRSLKIAVNVLNSEVNALRVAGLIDVGIEHHAITIDWHDGREINKYGVPRMVARLTKAGLATICGKTESDS